MLIDVDINEVFGVDVVEDGEGLVELVVGIGDPEDSGTTVLSFIAGWEADLEKIDLLISGLEKFKTQATAAANQRKQKAVHPQDAGDSPRH
ncbi:MAG: hypothetical protein U0840_08615 [Gemmataceae bacterium]